MIAVHLVEQPIGFFDVVVSRNGRHVSTISMLTTTQAVIASIQALQENGNSVDWESLVEALTGEGKEHGNG